jgi:hypothetical protein
MITAELKDAVIVRCGDFNVAYGTCYNDSKGRFADGESIRTSYILDIRDDLIITLFTG